MTNHCQRCSTTKYLQWHHVDPTTKSFEIWKARKLKKSPEEVEAEKAKCVRLCRDCHQVLHADHLYGDVISTSGTWEEARSDIKRHC